LELTTFYLVLDICGGGGVFGPLTCQHVIAPNISFSTIADCRHAGAANSNMFVDGHEQEHSTEKVTGYICIGSLAK
jgi:hypothetical protein